MKKFILFSLALFVGFMAVNAQDAKSVIDRYKKAVNMPAPASMKGKTMEMTMETSMMGMSMPSKTTIVFPDKMRTEVSAMGMDAITIINGNKGWVSVPAQGMKQEVPADQIAAMASQGDPIGLNKWDDSKINTEYIGESTFDGKKVEQVKVCNKDNTGCFTASFDKENGLLIGIEMTTQAQGQTVDVKSSMKDYKTFGGMKIPTKIEAAAAGMNTTVLIKDVKFDVPVDETLFAEPK